MADTLARIYDDRDNLRPRQRSTQAVPGSAAPVSRPGADLGPARHMPTGRMATGRVPTERVPAGRVPTGRMPTGQRPEAQKAHRRRVALRIVIAVLGLVLVGQIVYFGIIAPRMALKTIRISGLYGLTEQEVLDAAGIRPGMMILDVDSARMQEALLRLPQIREARVGVEVPNGLTIDLSHREPLGRVLTEDGMVSIDASGVVFPVMRSGEGYGPVISGLPLEDQDGLAVAPYRYRRFLTDLSALKLEEPALFGVFSQFEFETLEPAGFQVWVYPTHVRQRVLVGERFTLDHAVAMLRVLSMLQDRGELQDVWDIDFRTGDVIYTRSGGAE